MAFKGIRNTIKENLGFRGSQNIAAWAVAGVLAYYLWVKPEREAEQERRAARERARLFASEKGIQDVDRRRPIADPQDTGLVRSSRT
ncbi:g6384 [Coccomyxa elongata]